MLLSARRSAVSWLCVLNTRRRLYSLLLPPPLTACLRAYRPGGPRCSSEAHTSVTHGCHRATDSRLAVSARTLVFREKTSSSLLLLFPSRRPPHGAPVLTPQRARHLHTSGALRALPAPLLWLLLKPLQKVVAVILGRSIRKWWVALPPNRRQLAREAVWRSRWLLAAIATVVAAIATFFLLTHLDETPVTGRTRLLVFSRENYMELAAVLSEAHKVLYAEQLVPASDPRHQLVERVVQHLAERNKDIPEVSSTPWTVHVVQDPNVNAFVLPNGDVFMFSGMLDAVADIHQLTFVLGHEMAHVILGHAAEEASLSHVVDLLSLILLTAIWAVCPRDSLAVLGHWIQGKLVQLMFSRPFSRKLEAEADEVGVHLAAKACADVRAAPVFWQQMEFTVQLRGEPTVPEWLSTHPSHRHRVTQMDRLVPQALELRECCECPALPAADPRVVFARSVQVMLDETKARGRGAQVSGSRPVPRPRPLHHDVATAAAALLPPPRSAQAPDMPAPDAPALVPAAEAPELCPSSGPAHPPPPGSHPAPCCVDSNDGTPE